MIPLLWQLKTEFEDGLINFKALFLKTEKIREFLFFKSKLFHSLTVDGKKRISKEMIFSTKETNVIISSCNISYKHTTWIPRCFNVESTWCVCRAANTRKYSEEILRRLTFKSFEKVAEFSIPSSFTEWF